MGNTQSLYHLQDRNRDVTRPLTPSESTSQTSREAEAVVTTHQPGHLYSHTLSLEACPDMEAKASDQRNLAYSTHPNARAIVAGSQFARYGASDTSLNEPASTSSDASSSVSLSEIDAPSRDSPIERSEILQRRATGVHLEVNTDHEPLPSTPSTLDVKTPRVSASYSMCKTPPGNSGDDRSMRIAQRSSVLFSDDVPWNVNETPRTGSREPDSDDDTHPHVNARLRSLPSYLKIPTAIPRSFTSSRIAFDDAGAAADSSRASKFWPHDTKTPNREPESGAISAPPIGSTPHDSKSLSAEFQGLGLSAAAVPDAKQDAVSSATHPTPNVPLTPVNLIWRGRGKRVYVTGTFADEWQSKIPLRQLRPQTPFLGTVYLPPGTHRLKFIVDDRWRVSSDMDTATDGDGTLVNYVEIPNLQDHSRTSMTRMNAKRDDTWKRAMHELKTAHLSPRGEWEELSDELPGLSETIWTSHVPSSVELAQEAEEHMLEQADHVSENESSLLPRPPQLPRQLEKVILNAGISSKHEPIHAKAALVDDNSVLPAPNHAVLNHLATGAIKNGVLAMGTVSRYKHKYVTTVLYRPVHM